MDFLKSLKRNKNLFFSTVIVKRWQLLLTLLIINSNGHLNVTVFERQINSVFVEMGGKYSSCDPMDIEVPELKKLMELDPYLNTYEKEIRRR